MGEPAAITLYELTRRVATLVTVPQTQNVWVTAELSDVAVRGGHCYMELLQKDPATGQTLAKARAAIWANVFRGIRSQFFTATGQDFATGLKVMLRLSVSMHPVYGMSMVVNAVDPSYTMGDLLRRRREMLERLRREGILDINRSLCWPEPTLRIAVVSAEGAAGYGDFINQLARNPRRLRFSTRLFPAVMQGDRTVPSVLAALRQIEADVRAWDCVVIIRGGGSTSDLLSFESYDLAAAVAQFPIPVIVGIGHERDVTILDYVACKRVKTPTAAAEWLIELGGHALDRLDSLATDITLAARRYLSGCAEQLSLIEGRLPASAQAASAHARQRLDRCAMALQQTSARRLQPQFMRLESLRATLAHIPAQRIGAARQRLDSLRELLGALSPEATLRRGYSITRVDGRAVTSATDVAAGQTIVTTLASGTITSTVN